MRLSTKNCGKILYELTRDARGRELDKIVNQFILFLTHKQMLSKIEYILKEFVDHAKEQLGVTKLEIISFYPLTRKQIGKISKYFGKKVEIEVKVDKTILGGVRIKNKNTIMNASLKTQLQRLEKELIK